MESLRRKLRAIDGRGYRAYKGLLGSYQFRGYTLFVDHVQGDPFAAPSRVRVRVAQEIARIPPRLFEERSRRIGLTDYLTRSFSGAAAGIARGRRGTGTSGLISVQRCGQEILERSSVLANDAYVEARFTVGLPARGRTALGKQAEEIFFEEIPSIVASSLNFENLDKSGLSKHVEVCEDQDRLRGLLRERGYCCFIADGSIMPRRSGIDDRPMSREKAVPARSAESLRVILETPNSGDVTGMAIARGVTLIVGGGYHGKSTVLRAIERGIYNHIPGDGREYIVTDGAAVKIRAEDGRRVEKVDISGFLDELPDGVSTEAFSTDNASGSTSQAANIMEAVEVGASVLLMDEDTCATNFMIRDRRMQELVAKEKEPITPFLDRARELYTNLGVSTILVLGGSGDYFDVADTVISLDTYVPGDMTALARKVAREHRTDRKSEAAKSLVRARERAPHASSFDPSRGKRDVKIDARAREVAFGTTRIDLACVEQIVDAAQTRAIGDSMYYISREYANGSYPLSSIVEAVARDIEREGLDILSPFKGQVHGGYALPRKFELAAAINRMRTLSVSQVRAEVNR
jgi:predicted ABC-class ATPase